MPEQPLILMVDDEADFREIFGAKLGAAGLRVETAENGEIGLKKAKSLKPKLILLDMNMPIISGADVLLKLRGDPDTKSTPVVFLTNLGDPREEIQKINTRFSQGLGAQGYLKKTDSLDVLVEQIKSFLK